MANINDLLNLFSGEMEKKALADAYNFAISKNRDMADGFFSAIYFFKMANPKIQLVYNSGISSSYYLASSNTVYLKNPYDLFHEFTHLLSFTYSNGNVPDEYYTFKRAFLADDHSTSLIMELLKICKKIELDELLQNFIQAKEDADINSYSSKLNSETINRFSTKISSTVYKIEDIIDAIYSGKALDGGIVDIIDNYTIVEKAPKMTAGHGESYYQNSEVRQFEEIMANYMDIKLTDPNNKLFSTLNIILGEEFVAFLDKRCNAICLNSLNHDYMNNISI